MGLGVPSKKGVRHHVRCQGKETGRLGLNREYRYDALGRITDNSSNNTNKIF
jgi:hypothetical protein